MAKTLVSQFLESVPEMLCKEVLIPKQCVGRVIGHDGKVIRSIEEKSKATVFVDLKRIECNCFIFAVNTSFIKA